MVSGTLKLNKLISWTLNFEIAKEDSEYFVYYYLPDGKTLLKIKLDSASEALLKQKKKDLMAFLSQDITLSGEVAERWEKRQVTKPEQRVEEWVQV
jgi:hypothetical protein